MSGARQTSNRIPLSRVEIDAELKERLLATVEAGHYVLGPECRAFERELAAYFGCEHAILVASATAGLMLSLQAWGVQAGDEVLVPSHTAFPTIEAILELGARPVFLDIDETGTLDPEGLEPLVGSRAKAVVPVHLYGHPCHLDRILEVADRHGLRVLEDCAQAHGARYRDRAVGSWGGAGVLSFYPSKNLPVLGDGGAVVTDDADLADALRMLRNHGRRTKFEHERVGWNLRFSDLQAAVGRVFLERLDARNEARRRLAARYDEALQELPLALPQERSHARHVYHLYVVRTPQRDALAKHLEAEGIETGIHFPVPCHLQPATLAATGTPAASLPRTEAWAQGVLSLPLFPTLSEGEVERVAKAVRAFFEA